MVSRGEWQAWGQVALGFLPEGGRVLELAHGSGHLYLALARRGYWTVALDRSAQMSRLLRQRSLQALGSPARQARADAQRLPFRSQSFDAVVCTFPTRFILLPQTLSEIRRVLRPEGVCVIVPAAELTGNDPVARLLRLAYRLTGQHRLRSERARSVFEAAGYTFREAVRDTLRARVTVWTLTPLTQG
ncbi:MAG: methyltransferase domain-containing protein, partial [Thermoflexales bacterium]|nr:methyltransferase domain-containing protein [Thermoflexales bacterium]